MLRRKLDIESWRDAMLAVSGSLDHKFGGPAVDLGAADNRRRTIYGRIHRRELDKMLQVHDFPDPAAHSPARAETTTPLQSLFALNGPLVIAQAERLAARVEKADDPIGEAYALLFQRQPTAGERQLGERFLAGEPGAWPLYAQALLASNEFLYVD
jgi:hypothetical protein